MVWRRMAPVKGGNQRGRGGARPIKKSGEPLCYTLVPTTDQNRLKIWPLLAAWKRASTTPQFMFL